MASGDMTLCDDTLGDELPGLDVWMTGGATAGGDGDLAGDDGGGFIVVVVALFSSLRRTLSRVAAATCLQLSIRLALRDSAISVSASCNFF